ncbi:MAG: adenylate/guanylate cyclase domain-containing protein [Anaerolineae bacterium]|nr:adenylate/guanylate cyclase domain-containing protein [Anaerolineae bacterium]
MRVPKKRLRKRLITLVFTPRRPLRRLASGLVVGIFVGGLMALGLWFNLFNDVRLQFKDALYQPRATRNIVTIVAIDDASLDAYGRSTVDWSRSVYIDLINTLQEGGARVIVFDVLFTVPSEDDAALADTMRQARNIIEPVVGSQNRVRPTTKAGDLIAYDHFIYPAPELEAAAMSLGHVNVVPDGDNFVRKIPLFVLEDGQPIPALGLAAYLEYLRMLPEMVEIDTDRVRFAGRDLPTDSNGRMLVYFFGPPSKVNQGGTFPAYSLVDVVEGRVSPDVFQDQIVLIGVMDAVGLPDSYPTPMTDGDQMFGVEIHANLIETIHQALPRFQADIDWKLDLKLFKLPLYKGTTSFPLHEQPLNKQLLITFLMAIGAGALLPFLRWYVGLLGTVLIFAFYTFWASVSFTVNAYVVEMLFPGMSLGFTFLGTMIVIFVFEERRRNQINDLFSRYVSSEIAQKIVEAFDQGKLELGGEEREITVLFADIRGFTTLSEGLPPFDVVALLNTFLEEMNAIVMNHGGAINKYIGDNLMAFWNAPYPQDDHAWRAVRAGLEMLTVIKELNEKHRFVTPLQFGIGINTGVVVVGNIGSQRRLEYTPIGDVVNVASRLSGIAPGETCYVGEQTYALVSSRVRPVEKHRLELKGKHEPVDVYELRPDSIIQTPEP